MHVAVLLVVAAVGLVRGAYWAHTTPVLSPFDEAQHLGYVHSLATGDGIPVVGEDRLPAPVLELAKASPTSPYRSAPLPPEPEAWGAFGHQYEAHQGPLYYVLLAPVHAATDAFGHVTVLFALRLATVLLALCAVPVAWLLAREVLPSRPAAWLAAPAVLVLVQGFSANTAAVTNDALLVPLAGAVLVPVARSLRAGPTVRRGSAAGALAGLGLLTKATIVGSVALAGVGVVAWLALGRVRLRPALRWLGAATAAGLAVASPWIAWHVVVYGADPASERVYRLLTETTQPSVGLDVAGVVTHLTRAVGGFWESHLVPRTLPDRYGLLWFAAALCATGATIAVAVRRRGREAACAGATAGEDGLAGPALRTAWLASAFLPVFVAHLVVVYTAAHGGTATSGRLLYAALVPTVVGVTCAAFLLFRRETAVAVLGVLVAVSLWDASRLAERHIDATYAGGAPGEYAPVVAQTWNDGWVEGGTVVTESPCQHPDVVLLVTGEPPGAIVLDRGDAGRLRADLDEATDLALDVTRARYRGRYDSGDGAAGVFSVRLPAGTRIGWSAADREPRLGFEERDGDPTALVLCAFPDAVERRFRDVFSQLRPGDPPRALVHRWAKGWALAGSIAAAGAVWVATRRGRRRRRRTLGARSADSEARS